MTTDALPADFADDTIGLDHDWTRRWRIPLVRNPYPRWKYEVALVVPPETPRPFDPWGAEWATEDEAEVVASLIGYRRDWYNDRWQAQMLKRPLDVDSGTNTVVLLKRDDGWSYRRATFCGGPPTWPSRLNTEKCALHPPTKAGLIALATHIFGGTDSGSGRRFTAWAEAHPEVWTT